MPELKPVGIYREMYRRGHDGLPSIHDAGDGEELDDRSDIIEYLRKAPQVFDVMESVRDLISDEIRIPGGSSLISDGAWIWRLDTIHYLETHPLAIPLEFVAHVRANHYTTPSFDRLDESFRAEVLRYF